MPRPSVKPERTEEILDAFEHCIARYSVEGATLERVAEQAGVARSLIRHHVGNRDALFDAFVDRYFEHAAQQIDMLFGALPASNRLSVFFQRLFDPSFANPHSVMVTSALFTAASHDQRLAERLQAWLSEFTGRVEALLAQETPEADALDRRDTANGIVGIYSNLESLIPLGPRPGAHRTARRVAERLVGTLKPAGAA